VAAKKLLKKASALGAVADALAEEEQAAVARLATEAALAAKAEERAAERLAARSVHEPLAFGGGLMALR
jgi:hypothetical protein